MNPTQNQEAPAKEAPSKVRRPHGPPAVDERF